MFPYSKISSNRLATCHEDLQTLFREIAQYEDTSILCGHRNELAQTRAFLDGFSKLEYPDSKHNSFPSMAVDAGPYEVQIKDIDWTDEKSFCVFAGKVLLLAKQLYLDGRISHQVIWGGDWDSDGRTVDHKFIDMPHFELTKDNVWKLPDEQLR